MFATLCSKPSATNALMGNTIASTLSATEERRVAQPDCETDERVAEHAEGDRLHEAGCPLACAIASAFAPTTPWPNSYCRAANTSATVASAPARFPA